MVSSRRTQITNVGKDVEKMKHLYTVGGKCKVVQTLWRFLESLKIELPHDLATPLLSKHLKKIKHYFQKDTNTPMFIAAIAHIYSCQDMEAT